MTTQERTLVPAKFDPSIYDPTEPIHTVITVFKICGIWPINYRFRKLYLLYGFFFQFAFTFAFCGFKLLNFYFKTNMDLITVIIFESLAEISLWVRVINFVTNFDRILHCLNVVKSFKCRDEEELNFYRERLGMFKKVMRFYVGCASFACFFSLVAPFFSDKPMLAYPAWYPLDWQNNTTHFWIAYTYQFVGILFLAHTLVLLEAFHIYLLITIGGQLDILAQRLRDIGSMYRGLPDVARQEETHIYFEDNIKIFEVISRYIFL
ncbi:hypothetical protein HA402_011130 [Bradysia odoriphaga]|nr:hypothetical protein HA402_011130 [Bradysia odoriphaga]